MMSDDIERISFSADEIRARVQELGAEIARDYQDASETVYCVGILKGAAVFFTDLVRAIDLPVTLDFMQLSSYGSGTSSTGDVQILLDLAKSVAGRNILLIEDIVDSGLSMHYLMENFRHRKAKSVKLCSLLSKPSRRKVDVKVDYCGAEVPDAFLVGYGLDYDQKYRNLPYLGILKPEIYSK